MSQAELTYCDYNLVLKEDDIKKEIEDMHVLVCEYCRSPENVDIYDPHRNTSPFICSSCPVDVLEDLQSDKKVISHAGTITTQTRSPYYLHFSYPETIVSSTIF